MRFILGLLLWFALVLPTPVWAVTLNDIYSSPTQQAIPEAVILYNNNNPCQTCDKAINMIIRFIRANYKNRLRLYLINTANRPEFSTFFKAYSPLTFVIIRISDGAAFGYEKLSGLQSQTDDIDIFNRRLKDFINNFLGLN